MRAIHSSVDEEGLRKRAAYTLGLLGMVPFWAALLIRGVEGDVGAGGVAFTDRMVLLYGLSIVSFLGGGRWIMRLTQPDTKPGSVFGGLLGAVVPALFAWVVAFAPDTIEGRELSLVLRLFLIALVLLFQFAQDWSQRHTLPAPWYLRLRLLLTLGATVPLILAAVTSWYL